MDRRAHAVLLGLTLYWGMTFVVVKDALEVASPLVFVALRFGVGGLALTAVAWRGLAHRPTLWAGGILGVFLFLGFAFQTLGLEGTTPARSAFITGMSVVLVPLISLVLFRRLPNLSAWAGVALAVLGLALLTNGAGLSAQTLRGDLLTLGCALAYGAHITLTSHYSPKSNVTAMVAVQLWVVSGLAVLALPLLPIRFTSTPALWAAVLYTGILGSAAAISLQSWAQSRVSAVRAAIIFSLEPVFAATFSVALGREQLSWHEVLGGGLVLAGVLVSELGGGNASEGERAPS